MSNHIHYPEYRIQHGAIGPLYVTSTAFTKSMETQNCRAGIQNFLHFLGHIWFRVMDNIVMYRHAKFRASVCMGETFLCKATLRFKTHTWYDDHENSVMHSTVMVSTGVGTSHINKEKIRVITIKRIYLTNKGCLPRVPYTETALLYAMSHKARSSLESALGHEIK